jgi:hypothetical protein
MKSSLARTPKRGRARPGPWARPALERLESRTLFAGHTLATATMLTPGPLNTAQANGFMATPGQDDLYRIHLGGGDVLHAAINSQAGGYALQSVLSVRDPSGKTVARDAQEGGDPRLTYQAPAAGDYFVDVTGVNATTGLYEVDVRRQSGVPLTADLAGSSFRIATATAAYGDRVTGTFRVENRGGAEAGAFAVQVVLSPDNSFGERSQVLTTFAVKRLGAGQAFTPGGFTVTLPDPATATAAGLPASGPVYLGLRIDPAGAVAELDAHDQRGVHRGADWEKLTLVTAVAASGHNHSAARADVLADPNSRVSGILKAGQTDWYQITVPASGRLTATVAAGGGSRLVPRMTLAGPNGQVLIQSDSAIVQHLPAGTYELAVTAASGAGTYQLVTDFLQGSSPFAQLPLGHNASALVLADFNKDGILDIVTAGGNSVSVLLGIGDGAFAPPQTYAVGNSPFSMTVADINQDGSPDIVTGNLSSNTVSVLLGNGDGTFQPQRTLPVGNRPSAVAVADVNGDGNPDIIAANRSDHVATGWGTVSVLLGNGDGTFQPQQKYPISSGVRLFHVSLAVADVNGDGKPDLVTANYGADRTGSVSVLLGNGDGTFQAQQSLAVASPGYSLAVADLNGDGKPDLVTANGAVNAVSVMFGNGDGTFRPQVSVTADARGGPATVADVNGDGKPDIVTVGILNDVSVLLGNGDGTFQPQQPFPVQAGPFAVAVADINGDGEPDIVTADRNGTAGILLGNGGGTFQYQLAFAAGGTPFGEAATDFNGAPADFNGDGKPDVVVTNFLSNTVSVLLGNGDGTLQPPRTFAAGSYATSVAVADFNGDGKPDIATTDGIGQAVSVLLGNGDGTFQPQRKFLVATSPGSVAAADVNGDGKPDLVATNFYGNSVSVLLGNGDGTFQPQRTFPAAAGSAGVVVADVNGDGKPDVITSSLGPDNYVSVLLGNGDGTFQPQHTFAALAQYMAVADVNGDGKPDIVATNVSSGYSWGVLLGNGDGTFRPEQSFAIGRPFGAAAVADVNGDGKPDLVLATYSGVGVLLGNGDGTFQPLKTFGGGGYGSYPRSVAVVDLNGDGKPDVVATVPGAGRVIVLLGNGDGTFTPISPVAGAGLRNTPYLADLTGDGLPDSVVLDRSGRILFRKGLPGADSPFAPPVPLNADRQGRILRPGRDLTVLRTPKGLAVAAVDESFDPNLSGPNHFVYTISVYTVAGNGTVQRASAFSTTLLPTHIAAADLTGDGLDDLVVTNTLDDSVQVAFQQPWGGFSAPLTLATGQSPSDISLVDVNGDGATDIAVSNQASGDFSVFLNDASHSFATSYRFRSGTGLYGLDTSGATPAISTLEQSVSLAAGDFTGTGRTDFVVVNRGTHSFTLLPNDGAGGFGNPQAALTTSTNEGPQINQQPGKVVAGDFNGDGKPDVAVLMQDTAQVWVYTNQGHGTFAHTFTIAAGSAPTGLNLARNPQTGLLDILVGSSFGDVLHLQGKGDGTFQLPGRRVSLDVHDLGNGTTAVLVANQRTDSITVEAGRGGASFAPVVTLADGSRSTLAPGNVYWAKLDPGSPYPDAVVVGSGGNAVLVYRGTGFDSRGAPTFAAPVSYSVGDDPVSLTIADVNGDGIPDMLVADRGSNDVAELLGALDGEGHWTATAGPRFKSGGSGPVAVNLVADAKSLGGFDLAVTNGQSGTVALLPGRGQGFFDDRTPQIVSLNTPVAGGPIVVGGEAVFPMLDGALVGFNLATLGDVHTVFDSTEVSALGALPDGDVAVARADGNVDLLHWDSGLGQFDLEASLTALSGLPVDPTALAVLQSDSGLRVLVAQAGSDALFVFALPSGGEGVPGHPASTPEPVASPLPTGLVVVVTLLSNRLALDTAHAAPAAERAGVALPLDNGEAIHEAVQSGTSEDPEEPQEEPPPLVSPFAGPNPVEALEKIRLLGPASDRELVPAPERGPMPEEAPPRPRSSAAPVAPRDLVWAELPRLEGWLPAGQVEEPIACSDLARVSTDAVDSARPLEPVRVPADGQVSRALMLLAFLDFQETWRRWEKEGKRRSAFSQSLGVRGTLRKTDDR